MLTVLSQLLHKAPLISASISKPRIKVDNWGDLSSRCYLGKKVRPPQEEIAWGLWALLMVGGLLLFNAAEAGQRARGHERAC